MKPCERVDTLLSAFLENETSPAETRFVDDHMAACARCRQQVEDTARLIKHLSDLPKVSVSDGFTEQVLARTANLAPVGLEAPSVVELVPRRPAWVMPLAAAAALAVMATMVVQVQRSFSPEPETAVNEPVNPPSPFEQIAKQNQAVAGSGTESQTEPREIRSLPDPKAAVPLGMGNDAYVVEEFELREPMGGGNPIITRVSTSDKNKVVVTF
jgi:anti-sigma factor RsiW